MTTKSPQLAKAADAIPIPRRIPFEFPDDLDPQWHPRDPLFAAMANGASLTMPYLEPFLIKTVREVIQTLDDPHLQACGRAFNMQEQAHYKTHRRYNDLLKTRRYPELESVEERMRASYARLAKRPLRTRMAYTAGFESMTIGLTKWLVGKRVQLFAGSDTRVASFILWHMVEETEHKRVAYDIYQSAFGGTLRGYLARAKGVFHGALEVMWFSRHGYQLILKHDGLWNHLSARLRLARRLWQFACATGPSLLKSALPGHDPRHFKNAQWVTDWLAGYNHAAADTAPLVNTFDPFMPVPFAARNHTQETAA